MFQSLFIFPESRGEYQMPRGFRPYGHGDLQSIFDMFGEIFDIERNAWTGRSPLAEDEDFDDSAWDDEEESGYRVEKDEDRQQPLREVERESQPKEEPLHKEPPAILEIACDPKYQDLFEKLFPGMVKPVEEKPPKNPFVFIANRLTFLIQSKHPLVFDTSNIKTDEKSMTIAVNEGKTIPKLEHIDELGFITSEVNRDADIRREIEEYLDGTEYGNIYCFPTVTRKSGVDGEAIFAIKFVVYPRK